MPSLTQIEKKREKKYKSYNNTFSKLHFLYSTSNTQENENVYECRRDRDQREKKKIVHFF